MMRAVDAVMECLKAEGVDVVFGYPGGANLPTYDAFVDAGIRHILVRHEAGGGHAAEGYAKASGKVGVVFATSGPGATNIVTPLTDAMMDSVPLVAFTGQVRTDLLGTDGFQEADTFGITMPIVKHSFMIQHPAEIPRVVHEAFHIARTGRPGPVLIDMPVDLTRAEIDYEPVGDVRLPGYQPTTEGNSKQIRLAAKALANARRPVLYAGGGVISAGASAELTELALVGPLPGHLHADGPRRLPGAARPVARDARDARHPRGELRDGRGGPDRRDRRPLRRPHHGQAVRVRPAGEVHPHRRRPGGDLQERPGPHPDRGRREEHPPAARHRVPRAPAPTARGWPSGGSASRAGAPSTRCATTTRTDTEIKPQYLIEALYEATGGEAIVASDVGQHQMWTAQYFHFAKPRRWINSGGLGTMGFGLPAGMGAAVARPDVPTIVVTGDGSIQMNAQELATCAEHRIPVKVFIANNGYLGMVRQWQELFWDKRYSQVDMGQWPDFVKLAEAYGATGMRLTDKTTLVADIKTALETEGPVVVDVRVTREENTYPMIPAGAAAREMVG